MDNDLFLKKLTEVADWEIPESIKGTLHQPKHRANYEYLEADEEVSTEVEVEDSEELTEEEINRINLSFPPRLLKVKVQAVWCTYCGRFCEKGLEQEVRLHRNPRDHWRRRCVTCGKYQDPYTKEINLSLPKANALWTDWWRENGKRARRFSSYSADDDK